MLIKVAVLPRAGKPVPGADNDIGSRRRFLSEYLGMARIADGHPRISFVPLLHGIIAPHMIMVMHEFASHIFDGAGEILLDQGETLFGTGKPVSMIYLVKSGEIRLVRHTSQGFALVLNRSGPGEILAEASVYSETYHCDAKAVAPTKLGALPKALFLSRLANAGTLSSAWTARLARSLQAARLQSEIRSLPRVADRLDAWLDVGNILPAKGHWQDVAAELSVAREALYRELARRRATSGEID